MVNFIYNPFSGNLDVIFKQAGGGGGVTEFKALTDTPSSYAGQAGKQLSVNVGETGLQYIPENRLEGESTQV